MTQVKYIPLGTILIVALFFSFVLAVEAQTNRATDYEEVNIKPQRLEGAADMATSTAQDANYNNTRSNRSTISVSGETNVCDGVTCADGSCAATEDECSAVAPVNESVCSGYLCDDGTCMSSEAMCGFDFEEIPGSLEKCTPGSPVRCGDGSCAAEAGICLAIEKKLEPAATDDSFAPDYEWQGIEADFPDPGLPENENVEGRAQNYNSSRSNKPSSIAADDIVDDDSDDDGDGLGDGTDFDTGSEDPQTSIQGRYQRSDLGGGTNRAQDYNAARSNKPSSRADDENIDPDDQVDGTVIDTLTWDTVSNPNNGGTQHSDLGGKRAKDFNSSRSNKPSSIFDDGGERPEIMAGPDGFFKANSEGGDIGSYSLRLDSVKDEPKDGGGKVYAWSGAEDDDGKLYAWGRGISVAVDRRNSNDDTAGTWDPIGERTSNPNDDTDESDQERVAALQVKGDDVRGWSEEERTAWQEYRASKASSTVAERVMEKMIEQTQSNERVRKISANENVVEMRYQARLKLFGFIPMEREVRAESNAAGEVEIDYPWYSFLATKPDTNIATGILNSLTGRGGGAGKVNVSDLEL